MTFICVMPIARSVSDILPVGLVARERFPVGHYFVSFA